MHASALECVGDVVALAGRDKQLQRETPHKIQVPVLAKSSDTSAAQAVYGRGFKGLLSVCILSRIRIAHKAEQENRSLALRNYGQFHFQKPRQLPETVHLVPLAQGHMMGRAFLEPCVHETRHALREANA